MAITSVYESQCHTASYISEVQRGMLLFDQLSGRNVTSSKKFVLMSQTVRTMEDTSWRGLWGPSVMTRNLM